MTRPASTNPTLERAYRALQEQSRRKFLANDVHVDKTWGQAVWGVALQVDLSEEVKDLVRSYQESLQYLEPDTFFLLPREYQHLSVNQVIFWGGTYQLGHEKTWESIEARFVTDFLHLNKVLSAFEISFRDLVATPDAIILCGYDRYDQMQQLRNSLRRNLPFPAETTKRNDIIHTTVARYKQKLREPMRIWDFVRSQRKDVKMIVDRVFLRKELVFPSLRSEELAQIDLWGGLSG